MTVSPEQGRKRLKRRRRSIGKSRFLVLAVGLAGVIIGIGMICGALASGNLKLGMAGAVYFLCSSAVLGFRGIWIYMDEERRSG